MRDLCLSACVLCAQGMRARNLIHARIEENIRAKICGLQTAETGGGCKDALQLLIEHSWERGERLDMQVSGSFSRGTAEFGPLAFLAWFPRFPKCLSAAQLPRVGSTPTPREWGLEGGDTSRGGAVGRGCSRVGSDL